MTARKPRRPGTLWSPAVPPDALMMAYTTGDDRVWDARLLEWDILGSLGHVEGLYASRLLSRADRSRLRAALRGALRAARAGRFGLTAKDEDVHSAVERWLTERLGAAGERVHTGRSRNDQVACDLRLYVKDVLLGLHGRALDLTQALLDFALAHRTVLWPGYTHQRRAMPSSAGLWAAGLAENLISTAETLPAIWARVDRSPLGSAAGYGVPLPLVREAAMRALGFGGLDQVVTTVQLRRGKLEALVLFWCVDLAHDLGRLAADVVLYSAEEFGFFVLPPELATGSSIMPHKRNPDLFELTRARAAAVEGDLGTVLQVKARLTGGYHRDYQLLKEPLFRGLDRTREMLDMLSHAVPLLGVDKARGLAALAGETMATDEVMRRVEAGAPFRQAYREVARELRRGAVFPAPRAQQMLRRRRSTGNMGNLGLTLLRRRVAAARTWNGLERRLFDRAMVRLAGPRR
jgi:argininosuccinate lyase